MRKYLSLIAFLLVCLTGAYPANGDIALSISNVVDDAGENVNVIVSIADPTGSAVLNNFNLPLDFGSDGNGTPNLFTFNGAANLSSLTNFAGNTVPSIANYDLQTNGSGGAVVLSSTATPLFSLNFTIDPTAPLNAELPISFENAPAFNGDVNEGFFQLTLDSTSINAADPTFFTVVDPGAGLISLVAVPEPSSIALAMAAFGGLLLRRRRS